MVRVLLMAIAVLGIQSCDPQPRGGWDGEGGGVEACRIDSLGLWSEMPVERVDLSGSWAQRQVRTSRTEMVAVGNLVTTTTSWYRLGIEQTGRELAIEVETCSLQTESDRELATTTFGDGMVANMGLLQREAQVESCGAGTQITWPRTVEVFAAELDDPNADALPTEPDDPAVRDFDQDGNPGFTVYVGGMVEGEIYLVQRQWSTLEGLVLGRDWFDGLVRWEQEQVQLGESTWWLSGQPETTVDPDPTLNVFLSTRIDDESDCAWILANRAALLER